MNEYAIEQEAVCEFTFTDASDQPFDPTDASFYVEHPDGTLDTFTLAQVTHVQVGIYTKAVTPDKTGRWYYKAVSRAPIATASDDGQFYVKPSRIAA